MTSFSNVRLPGKSDQVREAAVRCMFCVRWWVCSNKTGNARITLTLGRVRATIVAVYKQYVLHILSVCL